MLKKLRTFLTGRDAEPALTPSVPEGQRVYAIGDVHGRLDLFEELISRIEADDAARPFARTTVILLGDLVDRGPESAGVMARARQWMTQRDVRAIAGNHEEMFLGSFHRDDTLRHFLRHGGRETLLSYMDHATYARTTIEELRAMLPEVVPTEDVEFMRAMQDRIRIGDYLFVHAGIRPGLPIEQQQISDLRWIRGEFIQDRSPRDFVVVHGHTITDEPELRPTRIGIDTGAYTSGRLTAIGLEGTARWLLSAERVLEANDA